MKKPKMHEAFTRILDADGIIMGGFVRDFLIVGEGFGDIDFEIPGMDSPLFEGMKSCIASHEKTIGTTRFHQTRRKDCTDLSCNFFGLSKDGIFARPLKAMFSYELAFRMIAQKRYRLFNPMDARLVFKMEKKGWQMEGYLDCSIMDIPAKAPAHGSWQSLNGKVWQKLESLTL